MKLRTSLLLLALSSLMLPLPAAVAAATCAGDAPGGDWPSYGATAAGIRTQLAEDTIDDSNAGSLAPAWVLSVETVTGEFARLENTPLVADGCLFLATNTATIMALNADTAELVWSTDLPYTGNGYGGAVIGSPLVAHGRVYVGVGDYDEPYLAALDQQTGEVEWTTQVDDRPSSFTSASPVLYEDVVLLGFSGEEAATGARGGFAIVDAITGERLAHTYTISDDDFAAGYEGASIWTTPAVDEETGYGYAGGGNPSSPGREADNANALMKIDLDRDRPTFGQIVGSFKGNYDSYVQEVGENPACTNDGLGRLTCGMQDLDFGASLNVFEDAEGRTIVGALQKSGIYFALDADTMEPAWQTIVAPPCLECNAASSAVDADGVYVNGNPPSHVMRLDHGTGEIDWTALIGDVLHYQPLSTANGVIYTTTSQGVFVAYSSADGEQLLARPLVSDTGSLQRIGPQDTGIASLFTFAVTSAGVAIARNTVYVAFQDKLIAYRLPSA